MKRFFAVGVWGKSRFFFRFFLLSFLAFGLCGCSPFLYNDESQLAEDVFVLVNLHRTSKGLERLEWNAVVADECRIHSENMASGDAAIGHSGFEERASDIYERIPFSRFYENVGYVADVMGVTSPASRIFEEWLKSPVHRLAIEGEYDMTGVGVVADGAEFYFTQIFLKTK